MRPTDNLPLTKVSTRLIERLSHTAAVLGGSYDTRTEHGIREAKFEHETAKTTLERHVHDIERKLRAAKRALKAKP